MNEYIILNRATIQQRIEELEKAQKENPLTEAIWAFAKQELEKVLSQSTPLIPVLEQAYFEGECYGIGTDACVTKEEYISNLKLDI